MLENIMCHNLFRFEQLAMNNIFHQNILLLNDGLNQMSKL